MGRETKPQDMAEGHFIETERSAELLTNLPQSARDSLTKQVGPFIIHSHMPLGYTLNNWKTKQKQELKNGDAT